MASGDSLFSRRSTCLSELLKGSISSNALAPGTPTLLAIRTIFSSVAFSFRAPAMAMAPSAPIPTILKCNSLSLLFALSMSATAHEPSARGFLSRISLSTSGDDASINLQTTMDESFPKPFIDRSSMPSIFVPLSSLMGIGSRSRVIDSSLVLIISPSTSLMTPASPKKLLLKRSAWIELLNDSIFDSASAASSLMLLSCRLTPVTVVFSRSSWASAVIPAVEMSFFGRLISLTSLKAKLATIQASFTQFLSSTSLLLPSTLPEDLRASADVMNSLKGPRSKHAVRSSTEGVLSLTAFTSLIGEPMATASIDSPSSSRSAKE
mmetsp:Transcript_21968/g.59051  ORF Transcript_21968/g.59051 Transcript_21968/m.59051 type:complete len:322 (-) Transcript_21968:56-1021(-)